MYLPRKANELGQIYVKRYKQNTHFTVGLSLFGCEVNILYNVRTV